MTQTGQGVQPPGIDFLDGDPLFPAFSQQAAQGAAALPPRYQDTVQRAARAQGLTDGVAPGDDILGGAGFPFLSVHSVNPHKLSNILE